MTDTPLYTSQSTIRSLWQEYHIYDDHLEFDTLFGKMTIPFDDIEEVRLAESDLKGLMKGDLGLKNFRPALKLDWANFQEHVVIDKTNGFLVRRILFTPDDPAAFHARLEQALALYRAQSPVV